MLDAIIRSATNPIGTVSNLFARLYFFLTSNTNLF
ncbi:uncharacterized protein METZ01_LOCUS275726 [marine metagenome]|uniref:Uncharacterized protein n=1 Tax=marine metagenome TaxID=408172 RepID=A0A382KHN5_9ZZZZ